MHSIVTCNHHFEDGIPLCSIHYNELVPLLMTPASYANLAMTFTESSFLKAIQKLQVVMTICFKLFKTSVDKYIASMHAQKDQNNPMGFKQNSPKQWVPCTLKHT